MRRSIGFFSVMALILGLALAACGDTNGPTQPNPPSPFRFSSVSAGSFHACGVTLQGNAYCWGSNREGQLGDGTQIESRVPVRVAGGLSFASVSAYLTRTCGLTVGGDVYCWGGPLGNVNTSLTLLAGGVVFATLDRNCGVAVGGEAYCFAGLNPVRTGADLRFTSVSRDWQTCGIAVDGELYCWGRRLRPDGTDLPQKVAPGLRFVSVAVANGHSCAVAENNAGYCWGTNTYGQLGVPQHQLKQRPSGMEYVAEPTRISGNHSFASIDTGGVKTCGATVDGDAYCWGSNGGGVLGIGSSDGIFDDPPSYHPTPERVLGGLKFTSVTVGGQVACGVTVAGVAYCWGHRTGNRDAPTSYVPVPVSAP